MPPAVASPTCQGADDRSNQAPNVVNLAPPSHEQRAPRGRHPGNGAARAAAGGNNMEPTAVLSAFASRTRLHDINAEAIVATKRHILDCAGVALAAATEPAGRIIL